MATIKLKVKPGTVLPVKKAAAKPIGQRLGDVEPDRHIRRPPKGSPPYAMGRSTGGLVNSLVIVGHDYTYRVRFEDNDFIFEKLTNPLTTDEAVSITNTNRLSIDPETMRVKSTSSNNIRRTQ